MFQDKYRRDMEKVTPASESLVKTKEKMLKVCREKTTRRIYLKPLLATAMCLALMTCAVMFAVPQMNFNAPSDDQTISTPNTKLGSPLVSSGAKSESGANRDDSKPTNENCEDPRTEDIETEDGGGSDKEVGNYSYTDICKKIQQLEDQHFTIPGSDGIIEEDGPKDGPGDPEQPEFSDTNNQVLGVQEADIIKTDGKYIYACGNVLLDYYRFYTKNLANHKKGCVYILSADNGKLSLVSTIRIRGRQDDYDYVLKEILLYQDTMILIKSGYAPAHSSVGNFDYYKRITAVEIYDIADRANPVFKNELYQSGAYSSSRMIGKYLYIISSYCVYEPDKDAAETYIPIASPYDRKNLISPSRIFVPEDISKSVYNVITGTDVTQPENYKSSLATLGVQGTIYASEKNIYIASYSMKNFNRLEMKANAIVMAKDSTDLYRFSISGGRINLDATGEIAGKLINQFAMDEYGDTLRVAATVLEYAFEFRQDEKGYIAAHKNRSVYNALYTLDMDLKPVGTIHNLAPDETIHSVRFYGNIGYVVTFRNTDPLFAIDLSDPKNPKVLSALKIPGFSAYLHAYGDGLLFGLGWDTDSDCIKLSMFDVSDKTNVSEITVLLLSDDLLYSEAFLNHKAVLIDPIKNIIGFPALDYKDEPCVKFLLFKFENNAFVNIGSIPMLKDGSAYTRGLYIGNYIYVFSQGSYDSVLSSYDINTLTRIDTCQLR